MKYVKTENGVYELKDNMSIDYAVYWLFGKLEKTNKKHLFINDKNLGEVVKEVDTIEELCDSFYWDCEDGFSTHNFMSYPIAKDTWDEYVSDCLMDEEKIEANMYGCIKTSKGLIYVAKMNLKGELELI